VTGSVTTGQEASVLSRLGKLPTAAISDALDREGVPGALDGLVPLSNDFRAAGPAFTVLYAPVDSAGGTVGDFLDEVDRAGGEPDRGGRARREHLAAGSREVRLPPPAAKPGMTEAARGLSASTTGLLPGDGDQGGRCVMG